MNNISLQFANKTCKHNDNVTNKLILFIVPFKNVYYKVSITFLVVSILKKLYIVFIMEYILHNYRPKNILFHIPDENSQSTKRNCSVQGG